VSRTLRAVFRHERHTARSHTVRLRVFDCLAYAALALAIAASVLRPLFYWDSWAYHLPFSALLWDIGGAREAFVLSDEMRVRYDGFPLLAEFIQGALWKLTGTINATALINSAALAVFVLVAARALRASAAVLAFGALAVPLVAMHAVSGYIDLFVGALVALQAVAAVKIERSVRDRRGRIGPWLAVLVGSAALAGNAKITAVVMSVAIGAFLAAYLVLTREGIERRRLVDVLLVLFVAALLASATLLKNVHHHGNPVYPFETTVAGIHLQGPEPEYRSYPAYSAPLGALARPVNWLLSISDLDWAIRGSAPRYSLDMAAGGDTPQVTQPRTGGYFGPLPAASLVLAVWLAVRLARASPTAWRGQRFMLALFLFVTIATAFMPQSHELRYHLHWPLLLMLVVAVLVRHLRPPAIAAVAAAYFAAFIGTQWMTDWPWRPWAPVAQAATVEAETRMPPLAEARERSATCLGPETSPRQFAYSAVFRGGDYVVEQGWTRCVRFPPLSP
jgi:hypothetical protein